MPAGLYILAADSQLAADWLDQLIGPRRQPDTEAAGHGPQLRRWWNHILAWHTTGASNEPAEAVMILLIKNIE